MSDAKMLRCMCNPFSKHPEYSSQGYSHSGYPPANTRERRGKFDAVLSRVEVRREEAEVKMPRPTHPAAVVEAEAEAEAERQITLSVADSSSEHGVFQHAVIHSFQANVLGPKLLLAMGCVKLGN